MNFYAFQPEKIVERSAQLPEAVVISVEFVGRSGSGGKKRIIWSQGGHKPGSKTVDPDRAPTPHARRTNELSRPRELGERVRGPKHWRRGGPHPACGRPLPGEVRRSQGPEQGHDGRDPDVRGADAIGAPAPRTRRSRRAGGFQRSTPGFMTVPTPEPTFSWAQGAAQRAAGSLTIWVID